ncbi:hypothetical protein RSOL_302390 [Rhizoctonia solani AG-3 Rhs1AP]|uniref:MYND-type domain-containing protein n=1 Tax=Rhizoctonia solani AG-3 Rhs1AP TaxID=1086054 RepID=A0A0A1UJJ7_9AGAM|nr:hypothetical protein RSOL_302390 [Rhizoctonia solani AG-3 Rhs1AP]
MEAYNSIDGCYYLFYKTGGFSSQDALFLLEIIWADRKAFMMLCDSIGDEMPGWGILLMAIWHHIKDLEDPDILLKRLRNLLLRYALIVPDMEFSLVVSIAQQIEETASEKWPQTEELPPVDIDDCRNMLRAFNKYLNSAQASQDSGQIMAAPFWLVYRNAFSVLPDEIPLLIGAAIERVWKILADSAVSTISRIMASFKYAMSAMWALSLVLHTRDQTRRQRRTTATTWIKLMQDIHFMELIGRLCSVLVLSTEEGGNGFLISHDQLEEFTECVGALVDGLKEVADACDIGQLEDLHQTWGRVLRYIDLQLTRFPQTTILGGRIRTCKVVWLNFGTAFKFRPYRLDELPQCMNPRCPNPCPNGEAYRACRRCCWVHYCTLRCQSMHWGARHPEAHRGQCVGCGC